MTDKMSLFVSGKFELGLFTFQGVYRVIISFTFKHCGVSFICTHLINTIFFLTLLERKDKENLT